MATLRERLEGILKNGPGNLKGRLRVLTPEEDLLEISIPFEDGFRKQGYYFRIVLVGGVWKMAIWEAGKSQKPKTAFYVTKGPTSRYTAYATPELEVKVDRALCGKL
jgi:hypothetical protein